MCELPVWASRVRQDKIRKLYEDDAQGIYDSDLILDVGSTLFARCCSFITACEAVSGMAACPRCDRRIAHEGDKSALLLCDSCGWQLTWGDYFATIQRKQLSGAEPVISLFQEYIDAFPAVKSERERVLLIDRLIHGFHTYYKNGNPTRPVAVNLIQGRLRDVIALLDDLSYSVRSTPGTERNRTEWQDKVHWARSW